MDRRQAAQLEWMRRTYALLTPEQRAIVDAADGRVPKDPNRSTAEVAFGDDAPNVVSDLDASATPMPAEPVLQPGRKRSRADWAVDATTAGGLYSPSENVDAMRVGDRPSPADVTRAASSQGMTPPGYDAWAEAMTDAETGTTRAQRQAQAAETGRRVDRQKETYDRETGLYAGTSGLPNNDGHRDWSGWQPGMPVPEAGRKGMRPGESEPVDPAGYTLPGPRTLDGKPVRPSRPLQTEEQASAYKERRTDPETGRRQKSQYDLDMEARGYSAVVLDNGTVGYFTTYAPATDEPTGRGAVGRAGDRPDLRNATVPGADGKPVRRYEPREMLTPTGERVQVWAPTQAAMEYTTAQRTRAMRGRLAGSAGLSSSEAAAMTDDQLRDAAKDRRMQDKQARADAWKAQSMLAGGQPTGGPRGTKAATNALMMLPPEWQSLVLAKGLRPDIDGTTPLTVDANSAKNAVRLLNAEMIGAGGLGDARAMMMQQQSRVAADEMAQREAAKLMGMFKKTLTRQEAERIRRRIEAVHPGMGGVVEGLPIDDDAPVVPGGVAPGSVPAV